MGIQDLRHKATACPDPSVHPVPSKVGPCPHNLWASDISRSVCLSPVKGQVSLPSSPAPGSKGTTIREGPSGPAPAWTPGAQIEVLSPYVKVVKRFCFVPL